MKLIRIFAIENAGGPAEKEKTRIHHQHLRLGEERPGLHCKYMKNSEYNKIFFDSAFSEARMKPYFDRYTETEYRYTFIYDGDSETLKYDCILLNGEIKFWAYGSTYML